MIWELMCTERYVSATPMMYGGAPEDCDEADRYIYGKELITPPGELHWSDIQQGQIIKKKYSEVYHLPVIEYSFLCPKF